MSDIFGPNDDGTWPDEPVESSTEFWMGQEITVYDAYLEPINSMTKDEWMEIVTELNGDDTIELFGIDNIDIIKDLERQGYWEVEDWEYFREMYEANFGN